MARKHLIDTYSHSLTPPYRKLFVLNGFGYAVDSLILLIQSIIAGQAGLEFNPSYPNGLTIAAYVGMLVGALFWGMGADIIGRKIAFNVSLIICSIFAIVAGASPNWEVLGLFVCLSAFGAGGNLVLDTAVFLEYLPSYRQWMLTLMAAWWGKCEISSTCICHTLGSRQLSISRSWTAHRRLFRVGLPSQLQL